MEPVPDKLRILSIIGARPQFIKALALHAAVGPHNRTKGLRRVEIRTIHTGQHFDREMSQVFFEEMKIPAPNHNLGVRGGSHGVMTARMLAAVEKVLAGERPGAEELSRPGRAPGLRRHDPDRGLAPVHPS